MNDERPSARRRATASWHAADVHEVQRSDDVDSRSIGDDQGAVARCDAFVSVWMPRVVQLGQQRIGQVRVRRDPNLLIDQLLSEPFDAPGVDVEAAHPTSLPHRSDTAATCDMHQTDWHQAGKT